MFRCFSLPLQFTWVVAEEEGGGGAGDEGGGEEDQGVRTCRLDTLIRKKKKRVSCFALYTLYSYDHLLVLELFIIIAESSDKCTAIVLHQKLLVTVNVHMYFLTLFQLYCLSYFLYYCCQVFLSQSSDKLIFGCFLSFSCLPFLRASWPCSCVRFQASCGPLVVDTLQMTCSHTATWDFRKYVLKTGSYTLEDYWTAIRTG